MNRVFSPLSIKTFKLKLRHKGRHINRQDAKQKLLRSISPVFSPRTITTASVPGPKNTNKGYKCRFLNLLSKKQAQDGIKNLKSDKRRRVRKVKSTPDKQIPNDSIQNLSFIEKETYAQMMEVNQRLADDIQQKLERVKYGRFNGLVSPKKLMSKITYFREINSQHAR